MRGPSQPAMEKPIFNVKQKRKPSGEWILRDFFPELSPPDFFVFGGGTPPLWLVFSRIPTGTQLVWCPHVFMLCPSGGFPRRMSVLATHKTQGAANSKTMRRPFWSHAHSLVDLVDRRCAEAGARWRAAGRRQDIARLHSRSPMLGARPLSPFWLGGFPY